MAHRLVDVSHDEAHLPQWTKQATHDRSSLNLHLNQYGQGPSLMPLTPPLSPQAAGLSREKSSGRQGKEFACQFRLGRACPAGLQPTDLIRGHPRLETVETKTWIRGSSPRKTTSTRFLGVELTRFRGHLSP